MACSYHYASFTKDTRTMLDAMYCLEMRCQALRVGNFSLVRHQLNGFRHQAPRRPSASSCAALSDKRYWVSHGSYRCIKNAASSSWCMQMHRSGVHEGTYACRTRPWQWLWAPMPSCWWSHCLAWECHPIACWSVGWNTTEGSARGQVEAHVLVHIMLYAESCQQS